MSGSRTVPAPQTFAIIGHPIAHSLSPLMHETAFRAAGIPHRCVALDVPPAELGAFIAQMRSGEIAGASVTIPHKRAIIGHLDELSPEAQAIGAVNTVVRKGERLTGHNTDVLGVIESLAPYAERLRGASSLVLGSGGAARALLRALTGSFGLSRITVAARSPETAEPLRALSSARGEIRIIPYDAQGLRTAAHEAALIVNCTPVGMASHDDGSPLPAGTPLAPGQIVFDVVYRPLLTTLLRQALQAGCMTVSGLEMFLHQGAAAYELWTGTPMSLDAVREAIVPALSERSFPIPSQR